VTCSELHIHHGGTEARRHGVYTEKVLGKQNQKQDLQHRVNGVSGGAERDWISGQFGKRVIESNSKTKAEEKPKENEKIIASGEDFDL